MKNVILLIYGTGGHTEEARRVKSALMVNIPDIEFVSVCDDDVNKILTSHYYLIPSVTDKYSYWGVLRRLPFAMFKSSLQIIKALHEYKIDYAISTGPGIGALLAPILKIYGIKIIHVENASRFKTKSLSGRILYFLADFFFIQNKDLQKKYPKAIYKGRL